MVENIIPSWIYQYDSSVEYYPIPFIFYFDSEIKLIAISGDKRVELMPCIDYIIANKNIKILKLLASVECLVIYRNGDFSQNIKFTNGVFPDFKTLELALDIQMMRMQELHMRVKGAISTPPEEQHSSDIIYLPAEKERSGSVIFWSNDGKKLLSKKWIDLESIQKTVLSSLASITKMLEIVKELNADTYKLNSGTKEYASSASCSAFKCINAAEAVTNSLLFLAALQEEVELTASNVASNKSEIDKTHKSIVYLEANVKEYNQIVETNKTLVVNIYNSCEKIKSDTLTLHNESYQCLAKIQTYTSSATLAATQCLRAMSECQLAFEYATAIKIEIQQLYQQTLRFKINANNSAINAEQSSKEALNHELSAKQSSQQASTSFASAQKEAINSKNHAEASKNYRDDASAIKSVISSELIRLEALKNQMLTIASSQYYEVVVVDGVQYKVIKEIIDGRMYLSTVKI